MNALWPPHSVERSCLPPLWEESAAPRREPALEGLPVFGFGAVSSMLVTYAIESPGGTFSLAFAAACALGSICGCLQGAWSIGLVEGAGALLALVMWRTSN